MIRIRPADLARLAAWAEAAYPQEACALLLGRRRPGAVTDLTRVEQSRNLADRPERAFEIDPGLRMGLERELRQAERAPGEGVSGEGVSGEGEGEELVGLWHSHPDGPALPSERDRLAVQEDLLWLLTAVADGRAVQTCAFRPVPAVFGASGGGMEWRLGGRSGGWRAGGFLPEDLVLAERDLQTEEKA